MPFSRAYVNAVNEAAKDPTYLKVHERLNELLTGTKNARGYSPYDVIEKTHLQFGDVLSDPENKRVIIKNVPAYTPEEVDRVLRPHMRDADHPGQLALTRPSMRPHVKEGGGGGADQPRVPAGNPDGGQWT
jgi:hypothetical protein